MRRFATLILVLLVMASVGSISVGQGGDGIVHTGAPAEGAVAPQSMQEALADLSALLGGDALPKASVGQQAMAVEFQDMGGNPISRIQRGNPVQVFAEHEPVGPLKGTCILILPVNDPIYKETMLELRQYTPPTGSVIGEYYYFYIPNWIQIEGTAVALVIVQDAGNGYATLTVVP